MKTAYSRLGQIGPALAVMALLGTTALAEQNVAGTAAAVDPLSAYRSIGLGIAAALAIGLSVLGAAHAVARIGSAALGLAAEKPELMTRSILFLALAEGLAVLGFAVAMMLVQKV